MDKKKKMMLTATFLLVLSLAGVTAYYWYMEAHYIKSNDALVDGSIVKISPQITGKIAAISVAEGDEVQVGDIIARQSDLSLGQSASLDLTVMRSPINGTIINKVASVGESGSPGQPVVMVCDLQNLYIKANIEETKLSKVKEGQKVEFTVDAFPRMEFIGQVAAIGDASVSTFSLMPAQAGGKFTKVVQRIPVKISIDDYKSCRLLPGMNVAVKINTAE